MNERKKCASCGTVNDENNNFCSACGSADFVEQPISVPENTEQVLSVNSPEIPVKDNIFIGIIGAFIFSLIGAAAYYGIYQIGVIAGICGFLMYWLASFGYDLFNGKRKIMTTPRIVVSVVMMLVMIFIAEWACIITIIIESFKEVLGVTIGIGEAINWIPTFMKDGEFAGAVAKDFAFAYSFGIIAVAGEVINFIKRKKAAQTDNQSPKN